MKKDYGWGYKNNTIIQSYGTLSKGSSAVIAKCVSFLDTVINCYLMAKNELHLGKSYFALTTRHHCISVTSLRNCGLQDIHDLYAVSTTKEANSFAKHSNDCFRYSPRDNFYLALALVLHAMVLQLQLPSLAHLAP
eukprot:CCRYP_008959-RA/>CCRYP_008959-RA protein AED:0.37 eAED:1.00 QI:0/0/0/1/0/0/3/0/135